MPAYGFKNIVGNSITIRLLKRSLKNNTFPQFSLLSGVYGTGKSTNAKNIALALTCEHPIDGEACMACDSCKANLKAFGSTGESYNVKIVNLGKFSRKNDVTELIKDIFILQSGLHNKVYIFEEAHSLASISGAQTAFLEEIDRMPPNTFVIMCTTEAHHILDALRSRAMQFTFNRLTIAESEVLLDLAAKEYGVDTIDNQVEDLIIENARGIPRDLLKALDFVLSNKVTEEELLELFHKINNSTWLELFSSMYGKDMSLTVTLIENILTTHGVYDVISGLKDFVIRALFVVETGNTKEGFSSTEVLQLYEMYRDNNDLYKIASLIEKLSYSSHIADVKLCLFNIRLTLQKRNLGNIVVEKEKISSVESIHAKDMAKEMTAFSGVSTNNKLTKLSAGSLNSFFGGGV